MPPSKNKRKKKPRFSFFKVLFGDFSTQLRIPPAFVKHIDNGTNQRFRLRSPAGINWRVGVEKNGDELFFKSNWRSFVDGNSLQFGDFLVFSYLGGSQFKVEIYGRTGCLKEVASSPLETVTPNQVNIKDKIEYGNQDKVKRGRKVVLAHKHSQSSSSHGSRWTRSKNKHLKASNIGLKQSGQLVDASKAKVTPMIDLDDSSDEETTRSSSSFTKFKRVTTVGKRTTSFVILPAGFKEYKGSTKMRITLQASNKSWPAALSHRGGDTFRLCEGWRNFLTENSIKMGDSCELEFIDGDDLLVFTRQHYKATVTRSKEMERWREFAIRVVAEACFDQYASSEG